MVNYFYHASYQWLLVDEVSQMYCLPYLQPVLSDNCPFPFSHLEVWTRVSLQSKSHHHLHLILPPQTINAGHPSSPLVLGCYDKVIMNVNSTKDWLLSGLNNNYLAYSSYIDFILFFRTCCQFMTHFLHHSNLSAGCIQKLISHLHPVFQCSPLHKCSCVRVWYS